MPFVSCLEALEPRYFILLFEKFDLFQELRFGGDSPSWWHTCDPECDVMKEEDVANVPIYAAIFERPKELVMDNGTSIDPKHLAQQHLPKGTRPHETTTSNDNM